MAGNATKGNKKTHIVLRKKVLVPNGGNFDFV